MPKKTPPPRKNPGRSRSLTPRELEFVAAFEGNSRAAARAIGMDPRNASVVRNRPLVSAAIKKKMGGVEQAIVKSGRILGKKLAITADRTLQELGRLAYCDPRKFFNKDGSAIPITELDDDTAMALAGFEVVEQYEGTGENRVFTGYLKKFKIADKGQNVERAMKYLQLFDQPPPPPPAPPGPLIYGELRRKTIQRVTETITQESASVTTASAEPPQDEPEPVFARLRYKCR